MHDDRQSMADGGIPAVVHLLTERISLDTYCSTIHSNENGASLTVGLVMSAYFVQSELCKWETGNFNGRFLVLSTN
jgi:hypothetical protein